MHRSKNKKKLRQVPEISGANKAAAFDGSMASMYLMAPQIEAAGRAFDSILRLEFCFSR